MEEAITYSEFPQNFLKIVYCESRYLIISSRYEIAFASRYYLVFMGINKINKV